MKYVWKSWIPWKIQRENNIGSKLVKRNQNIEKYEKKNINYTFQSKAAFYIIIFLTAKNFSTKNVHRRY